jgi:hypothetical protein
MAKLGSTAPRPFKEGPVWISTRWLTVALKQRNLEAFPV